MNNRNGFKDKYGSGRWISLLGLLLVGWCWAPTWADTECLIVKSAFWNMDDQARPYYEIKKQIAHEPCTLAENPNCPSMIQVGRYGSALMFTEGTGLTIERSGVFEWGPDDSFSVEFWMKRDNIPMNNDRNEVIIGRDDPSTELHWWIGVGWRGTVSSYIKERNGHIHNVQGNKLLNDNTWHHIVLVRDSQRLEIRLYVDGVLEGRTHATYDGPSAFESDTVKLNIGWIDMAYRYHYLGAVDEIAIYQMALPDWYIREQYHAEDRNGGPCE